MHTYLAMSGLAIEEGNEFNLQEVIPELNISKRSFKRLQNIISSY